MLSLGVVTLDQRQVCLRAGTLGELRQANIGRSLVDRQRSSYALVPAARISMHSTTLHCALLAITVLNMDNSI
jgi:hypothetical protein